MGNRGKYTGTLASSDTRTSKGNSRFPWGMTTKGLRLNKPFRFLSCAFLALATVSHAQQTGIRTLAEVNSNPTGYAPRGGQWSPGGRLYAVVATDSTTLNGSATVGQPGDIVQIDTTTGRVSVLATVAQLSALSSADINEKDLDHRQRYNMSAFLWAGDSRHLLVDNGGRLWLYDIAAGKGTLVVDTHEGSGDDPKFSPDGASVSYLRGHNLYVHSAAGEAALTSNGSDALLNGEVDWVYLEELEGRSNYFWSPDSSALAYLQMNEAKVPQFPIADWIPTHADVDKQRYPQPGDPNPDVRVGVVSAHGGETHWISVPFSPNNDYIPRFGWVDANTIFVQVLTRDHQHLNLYLADARTGRSHLLHADTDTKYLDDNYDVTFLPGGRFLNTSWRDGHTHAYLYQFDARHPFDTDATLVRQLTRGDFEVAQPDVRGETMFFRSNEGALLDLNLWSVKLDGSDKRRITSGAGAHDADLSPDGRHFVELTSTNTMPPVADACDLNGACTRFWNSTRIAPSAGVRFSRVSFLAADGRTTLYGTLTEPANAAPGSVPIILNPYGGPLVTIAIPNAWNGGQLFDDLMAQHGFAVLAMENRGMGGRGRDFQQACYRNFGPVQLSDQLASLDQALAQHAELDPKRIGWWGWSWGGSFTLYAMTHTDRIKAGVAVAPVTDWRNYDTVYTERYLGLPSAPDSPYQVQADVTGAAQLKGHLLLAQGTGDDNVHLSNVIQFINPLINAGIPYDLQLFPRKTHSIAGYASRTELFTRIVGQFERYLK